MIFSRISIIITFTSLLESTLAMPATLSPPQDSICATGSPQCCDVNVLGVADLNCEAPPKAFKDVASFNKACATVGKINMCCILPILNQALLCNSPDTS
ncbi:3fbedf31-637c-4793-91c3-4276fea456bc [Sclerotinia trifoliorum]|uniref:3fbedf31-637c-4793-91c3-4276fea456bc n=1 Tax=Sclerotinia trifoliorum TaxID=28548 RepID=A0A8H2ZQT9_9HELO|nr:3fbedf31-637c-4793-91c3-4276fea456bc [Sclerotinia trifoliorum]